MPEILAYVRCDGGESDNNQEWAPCDNQQRLLELPDAEIIWLTRAEEVRDKLKETYPDVAPGYGRVVVSWIWVHVLPEPACGSAHGNEHLLGLLQRFKSVRLFNFHPGSTWCGQNGVKVRSNVATLLDAKELQRRKQREARQQARCLIGVYDLRGAAAKLLDGCKPLPPFLRGVMLEYPVRTLSDGARYFLAAVQLSLLVSKRRRTLCHPAVKELIRRWHANPERHGAKFGVHHMPLVDWFEEHRPA